MVFHDHPFRVLGVGTRSKKSDIIERTQSLVLTGDADRVQSAIAVVTHPSKRIDAEVSWFPGMRPAQLTELLLAVDGYEDLANVEHTFGDLDPLTYLNLLYYWTIRHTALNHQTWVIVLQKMANRSAEIQVMDVIDLLNADRIAAGIPQIVDQSQVASALQRRKIEVVDSVLSHLLKAATSELVISDVVDRSTDSGMSFAGDFVYRLVDQYGAAIQPALNKCRDDIHEVCARITSLAGE